MAKTKKKGWKSPAARKRGKLSRRKGKTWERQIVRDMKDHGYPDADRRGWKQAKESAPDIHAQPFWIEAKHGQNPPLMPALEQAEENCPEDHIAIAVVKKNRQSPVVVMRYKDFLDVAQKAAQEFLW